MVQTGRETSSASTYTGSMGADTFIMMNPGDVLSGGSAGSDTLDINYAAILGGLSVDLSSTTDQIVSWNGSVAGGTATGFDSVDASGYTGSFGALLTGSSAANTITGTQNADQITGAGGADSITGGAGADTISVGSGADTVYYSADSDAGTAGTLTAAQGDAIDSTWVQGTDKLGFIGDFLTGSLFGTTSDGVSAVANTGGLDLNGAPGLKSVIIVAGGAGNTNLGSDLLTLADLSAAMGTMTNVAIGDERIIIFNAAGEAKAAIYKFTAGNTDADFEASELQLLGIVDDNAIAAADIVFT